MEWATRGHGCLFWQQCVACSRLTGYKYEEELSSFADAQAVRLYRAIRALCASTKVGGGSGERYDVCVSQRAFASYAAAMTSQAEYVRVAWLVELLSVVLLRAWVALAKRLMQSGRTEIAGLL